MSDHSATILLHQILLDQGTGGGPSKIEYSEPPLITTVGIGNDFSATILIDKEAFNVLQAMFEQNSYLTEEIPALDQLPPWARNAFHQGKLFEAVFEAAAAIGGIKSPADEPMSHTPTAIAYLQAGNRVGLSEQAMKDPWANRSEGMRCKTCMWFCPKKRYLDQGERLPTIEVVDTGRCRRRAPTMNGYPVVFVNDWCGDHKLNENAI